MLTVCVRTSANFFSYSLTVADTLYNVHCTSSIRNPYYGYAYYALHILITADCVSQFLELRNQKKTNFFLNHNLLTSKYREGGLVWVRTFRVFCTLVSYTGVRITLWQYSILCVHFYVFFSDQKNFCLLLFQRVMDLRPISVDCNSIINKKYIW